MKIDPRLQVLLDELPAMVAYWDRDLRNRYGNKAYLEWFGVTPQQMQGRHIAEVIGEHLYALNRPYLDGVLGGVMQTFDRTIVDASGVRRDTQAHYIPDHVDGAVAGFFALVTDLTDLKKTSEELSEAQRIGRLGSWAWYPKSDRTVWSRELYRLFGRDPELPAPSYAELSRYYTPQSWQVHNAGVERTLKAGEPYELELEYVREDGTRGWLIAHAQAQHDASGQVVKMHGTAQDVTERKKIELELLASRNQLREMVAHHEVACEEERKHIARELHDELGQLLSALKRDVALLSDKAGGDPSLSGTLADMRALLDKTFEVTRSVTCSLRPAALDFGLVPALEWLAQEFEQRWQTCCVLDLQGEELPLRDALAATIFRVVQESLTNVARHAHASCVEVSMRHADGRLFLRIRDNGCGFDEAKASGQPGFGLLSMRERVLSVGGRVQITSAPGQGTVVSIDVPT